MLHLSTIQIRENRYIDTSPSFLLFKKEAKNCQEAKVVFRVNYFTGSDITVAVGLNASQRPTASNDIFFCLAQIRKPGEACHKTCWEGTPKN